jgi:hypothetical protein
MKIFMLVFGLAISGGIYAAEEQSCDELTLQNNENIDIARVNMADKTVEILADIPLVSSGYPYPTIVKGEYLLNYDYESKTNWQKDWPIGCQGGGLEFRLYTFPVGNDAPQDLQEAKLELICYLDSAPNQIFELASSPCRKG